MNRTGAVVFSIGSICLKESLHLNLFHWEGWVFMIGLALIMTAIDVGLSQEKSK